MNETIKIELTTMMDIKKMAIEWRLFKASWASWLKHSLKDIFVTSSGRRSLSLYNCNNIHIVPNYKSWVRVDSTPPNYSNIQIKVDKNKSVWGNGDSQIVYYFSMPGIIIKVTTSISFQITVKLIHFLQLNFLTLTVNVINMYYL